MHTFPIQYIHDKVKCREREKKIKNEKSENQTLLCVCVYVCYEWPSLMDKMKNFLLDRETYIKLNKENEERKYKYEYKKIVN